MIWETELKREIWKVHRSFIINLINFNLTEGGLMKVFIIPMNPIKLGQEERFFLLKKSKPDCKKVKQQMLIQNVRCLT